MIGICDTQRKDDFIHFVSKKIQVILQNISVFFVHCETFSNIILHLKLNCKTSSFAKALHLCVSSRTLRWIIRLSWTELGFSSSEQKLIVFSKTHSVQS